MKIIFNRQEVEVNEDCTLKELLLQQGCVTGQFSTAVNQAFVLRVNYEALKLKHLDKVDIIKPMQGG